MLEKRKLGKFDDKNEKRTRMIPLVTNIVVKFGKAKNLQSRHQTTWTRP